MNLSAKQSSEKKLGFVYRILCLFLVLASMLFLYILVVIGIEENLFFSLLSSLVPLFVIYIALPILIKGNLPTSLKWLNRKI